MQAGGLSATILSCLVFFVTGEVRAAGAPPAGAPVAGPANPAKAKPARAPYPRLVVAGGLLLGPHAFGNERCSSKLCETTGTFFGIGSSIELRIRVWRLLYIDVRGLAVGNASQREPVYKGLAAPAIGFGAYGERVFLRAEYMVPLVFGSKQFAPPFSDDKVASDTWKRHAGLFSAGMRIPVATRLSFELWGGLQVGPRSIRLVPGVEREERVLVTFQIGVGVSWDALP